MKAVSAIFAMIIILLIVIALCAFGYIFFNKVFTTTATSEWGGINNSMSRISSGLEIESASGNTIYIRNTGLSDLKNFVVYVNGNPVSFSINPSVVPSKGVAAITINGCMPQSDVDINVVGPGVKAYRKAHKMTACGGVVPMFSNIFSNVSNSTAVNTGISINFGAQWSDDAALNMFVNSSSVSGGVWTNGTWQSFAPDNWTNFTVTFPSQTNSNLTVMIYANDSSNNQNVTGTWFWYNTTLPDTTPPTYSLSSTNSTMAGTPVSHNLQWNDNIGLSGYIFQFCNGTWSGSSCGSPSWKNETWQSFLGAAWSNYTEIVNSTSGANIAWCFYANDTSNNWNGTSCSSPFTYTTTLASPLVLSFSFNEANGTRVYDSSSYGNDGTFYGESFNDGTFGGESFNDGTLGNGGCSPGSGVCPSRVPGYFGNALKFNGNNQYASIPDSNSLDGTGMNNFTLEAWIKVDNFSTDYMRVIHKNSVYHMYVEGANKRPVCGHYGGTWQVAGADINILQENKWYHVACVYNHSRLSIYVNGIYNYSIAKSDDTPNNQSSVMIGLDDDLSSYDFNGTIDEVRIYNSSLTQAQIQADMNSPLPITRPVAAWSFEEPSNAKYINDTHIRFDGAYGSALNFDGINDYLDIPDSNVFNMTDAMTIATWVYPLTNQSTGGSNEVVNRLNWGTSQGFFLREGITQNHNPEFYVGNGTNSTGNCGSNCWMSAPAGYVAPNNWYYLVATVKSNDNISIYINGSWKSNTTFKGKINQTTGVIRIGYETSSFTKTFNGTIDEVRIWNRSLSQVEIQKEMNSPLPVTRPVASYSFEDGPGNRVNDTHIWVNGTNGSALSFDGINDFVNVTDDNSLHLTGNFTINAWIWLSSIQSSTYPCIVSKTNGNPDQADEWAFYIDNSSSGLAFKANNSSRYGTAVTRNSWQMVTAQRAGNDLQLYINGTSALSVANYFSGLSFASAYSLNIGLRSDYAPFNGTIDEVRIWNRSLSAAEILSCYQNGC